MVVVQRIGKRVVKDLAVVVGDSSADLVRLHPRTQRCWMAHGSLSKVVLSIRRSGVSTIATWLRLYLGMP